MHFLSLVFTRLYISVAGRIVLNNFTLLYIRNHTNIVEHVHNAKLQLFLLCLEEETTSFQ